MNNLTNFTETIKQECPKGWYAIVRYIDDNDAGDYTLSDWWLEFSETPNLKPSPTLIHLEGYLRGYLREKGQIVQIQYPYNPDPEEKSWFAIISDIQGIKSAKLIREPDYETAFLTACLEAFKYLEGKE